MKNKKYLTLYAEVTSILAAAWTAFKIFSNAQVFHSKIFIQSSAVSMEAWGYLFAVAVFLWIAGLWWGNRTFRIFASGFSGFLFWWFAQLIATEAVIWGYMWLFVLVSVSTTMRLSYLVLVEHRKWVRDVWSRFWDCLGLRRLAHVGGD